jgi:hypothetical protein
MPDDKLKVEPNEIQIDASGKVIITNKALAAKLKQLLDQKKLGGAEATAAMLDINFGCG